MNAKMTVIAILVSAVITFGLRALPFLVFQEGKELPDKIKRLGMVLPSSIMAVLIVYCLKDVEDDFVADGFREMQAADPYEAMAEKMVHCIYNGSVKERIQMAEKLAKQTDADGGILFAHWGCKGTIGASGLIKNVLETAGLPTMILDGDGCNPANTSDGQVSTRLQAFAEMLEKNKEEKHS